MAAVRAEKAIVTAALILTALIAVSTEAQKLQYWACLEKVESCIPSLSSPLPPQEICCTNLNETLWSDLSCFCDVLESPEFRKSFKDAILRADELIVQCRIASYAVAAEFCGYTAETPAAPEPAPL